MSVCINTQVEKLLHKTRKYLQLTAARNKTGTVRKNVAGDGFSFVVQLKANGEISIDGHGGENNKFIIHASHNSKKHLVFHGSTIVPYGRDMRQTSMPMDDRTLHYLLRTWLKNGLGKEWVSHRAPIRKREWRVRLTEGVLLAYK